jgi:rubrerythrin
MTMMITMMMSDNKRGPQEARHANRAGGRKGWWIDQELHDALEGAKLALFPVAAAPAAEGPGSIVRTYQCPECNYRCEATLAPEDYDAPPPECPACRERQRRQDADIYMDHREGAAEPNQRSAVNGLGRIVRTYQCPKCNYWVEVMFAAGDLAPLPPKCPKCRQMRQAADVQTDRREASAEPNQRSTGKTPVIALVTGERLARKSPQYDRVMTEMRAKVEAGELNVDDLHRNKLALASQFNCGATTAYEVGRALQEELKASRSQSPSVAPQSRDQERPEKYSD